MRRGSGGSHWVGCEAEHWDCALKRILILAEAALVATNQLWEIELLERTAKHFGLGDWRKERRG